MWDMEQELGFCLEMKVIVASSAILKEDQRSMCTQCTTFQACLDFHDCSLNTGDPRYPGISLVNSI